MTNKIEMGDMISENVLNFARYTITDRHFMYIEDGLKPSQRRILYSMYEDKLFPNKYRAKTFDILGSVSNYSPHGTQTLDGAMARLTNDTSLYPLIDGKGSFSSITSRDVEHASSRYTEGRLSEMAMELFEDIDKDAIDFVDNYNEQRKEPKVLPSKFPHVLVSAGNGMGMGISMKTASFNLSDVVDNTVRLLTGKPTETMYPDFETKGRVIKNDKEALKVKEDGKGKFTLRGTHEVSDDGRTIYIHEIPYTATREGIIDKVVKMVKENELPDVVDINDMTSSDGMEIEIKVKKNTDTEKLMAKIYDKTDMEINYHCDYWVIYEGKPYHLGTDDILLKWIQFRAKTIKRIKQYELNANNKKLHMLYGLQKVLLDIDKAIDIIKGSSDNEMIGRLKKEFELDDNQAQSVADTKLRNLTKTYIENKIKEIDKLELENEELTKIINSKKRIARIMINELEEIKNKYTKPRQTQLVEPDDIVEYTPEKEVIEDYNVRVFVTKEHYIKKIPLTSLRGSFDIKTKHGDEIVDEVETTNDEEVLIFTDRQNVYKKNLHELPDLKPSDLGAYIPSEIDLEDEETILKVIPLNSEHSSILIGYEDGRVAKIDVQSYRTKTNRSVLRNSFADKTPLLFKVLSEDIDLMAIAEDEKTVLLNTEIISSKATRGTQGNIFIRLRDDVKVKEYRVNPDFENVEYYRLKSASVGKYWKE